MWDRTWAGVGAKPGFMAGYLGVDSCEGVVFRLDGLPVYSMHMVNVTNLRLGAGLGGSGGFTAIFVFNASTIYSADGKPLKDWGFNFALPEGKVGASSTTLKMFKNCKNLKEIVKLLKSSNLKDIQNFRDIASFVNSSLDDLREGVSGSETKVVVIDIPGLGWGAEVSLFVTLGEFGVDKPINLSKY